MGGGPLEGLRVLDLSRVLAGPYCTMLLADLGAEVIKVEEPQEGDLTRQWGPPFVQGESAYYLSLNRNKRSVGVDIKSAEGLDIVRKLAARSDVVVENFRPGVSRGLGVGYEDLSAINPRIVYCSISGYGQDGPYRDRPAFDIVLQAMGGLMSITGERSRPPVRVGVAVADIGAGMFAALAILAALHRREAKGVGEYIDVAILDGMVAWMTYMAQSYFISGKTPGPQGSGHPLIFPYQAFPTADGHIIVGAASDAFWGATCRVLGLEELGKDPGYATNALRVRERHRLEAVMSEAFLRKTTAHWYRELLAAGVPCGPVQDLASVASDPQVLHRGMVQTVRHSRLGPLRVLGNPMKFSGDRDGVELPPPTLGEHTEEVLGILGIPREEVVRLRSRGVVA